MDLKNVIELFESKHTAQLSDRHAESIILLCDQMNNELTQTPFYFKELCDVARVLELIHEGIQNNKVSL